MRKDRFHGHSVKRPIVTFVSKFLRKRANRSFRRIAVELDEVATNDGWYKKANSKVNMAKLIGPDNPGYSFGHVYYDLKAFEDNQKFDSYEGRRRVKKTRRGTFFIK